MVCKLPLIGAVIH